MAEIPTPDLAVPYAAPKQVKTMADVQPIAPKNGYSSISMPSLICGAVELQCRRQSALASSRRLVIAAHEVRVTNSVDWAISRKQLAKYSL